MPGFNKLSPAGGNDLPQADTYLFFPAAAVPPALGNGPVGIADMANAFGVTHRTLHFYEEKGLIASGRMGPMRTYDGHEIRKMAVINCCREVGMPIAIIQELMEELKEARSQDESDRIFFDAMMMRKRELVAGLSLVRRQMQQIATIMGAETQQVLAPTNDNAGDGSLTEAETTCLTLMADGQSPARIAAALGLTESEALAIEQELIRKFSASNRFQVVAKAALLGLVE